MKSSRLLRVPMLLLLVLSSFQTIAQKPKVVKKIIDKNNAKLVEWLNTGKTDSIGNNYAENARFSPADGGEVVGREKIVSYYRALHNAGFKFTSMKAKTVAVEKGTATENGIWSADIAGQKMGGTYVVVWKLHDKKWLVEDDKVVAAMPSAEPQKKQK